MNKIINKNIKQKKNTICYTKVFFFQGYSYYFHQKIVIVGSINTSHCSENEPMPLPWTEGWTPEFASVNLFHQSDHCLLKSSKSCCSESNI